MAGSDREGYGRDGRRLRHYYNTMAKKTKIESNNIRRVLTGILGGVGIVYISGIIFRKTVWRPMLAIVFLFGFFHGFEFTFYEGSSAFLFFNNHCFILLLLSTLKYGGFKSNEEAFDSALQNQLGINLSEKVYLDENELKLKNE